LDLAAAAINFLFFVTGAILQLLVFAIIISAVLSWLIAFDVINYRNRFVYNLAMTLDRITGPIMAPFRRFIPPLGGIDVTPIIVLILISGVQSYLLPAAHQAALGLTYGF
jgi:YggT family protein